MYRYSDRLASLAAPANPFSTLLSNMRATGQHTLLDLTVSNPTEALANYPHAEISQALSSISNFRYQPDPFGNPNARQAIAHRLQLPPEQIALTASTSEAYALLFKLLANPGDQMLVPTPSYPLFDFLAHLESVQLRTYRLRYDGSWFIDFETLRAAITPRTRAIILVNPNNPTGSFLKAHELETLITLAQQHNLPLISDEVFQDYALSESPSTINTLNRRHDVLSFTLNGLSKAAGMPQMKLAWICINGPAAHCHHAQQRLELILDTYLSVSAPVQLAAEALLTIGASIQTQIRKRIATNLAFLNHALQNQPINRLHLEGGWSAILRMPSVMTEDHWITHLLQDQSVITQPGYFFDMPGEGTFLIVSLLTPEPVFAEGIRRIVGYSAK